MPHLLALTGGAHCGAPVDQYSVSPELKEVNCPACLAKYEQVCRVDDGEEGHQIGEGWHAWRNSVVKKCYEEAKKEAGPHRQKMIELYDQKVTKALEIMRPVIAPLLLAMLVGWGFPIYF